MNLFKAFESRVSDAFGGAPQGYVSPISFRRLAKSAAKQMEAETLIIDGVDTAPALYTVLVSPSDDLAMRPLYPQLTKELVSFVESQARGKDYVFVGEPLARFIVDPSLRSGKFAVFAENIDEQTLERLRAEERAFLSGSSAVGGAAADRSGVHARRRPTRRANHDAAVEVPTTPASHAAPVSHAAPASHAAPVAAAAAPIAASAAAVEHAAPSDGLLPLPTAEDIAGASLDDHAAPAFDLDSLPVISAFPPRHSAAPAPEQSLDSEPAAMPEAPVVPEVPVAPSMLDDSASMGLDIFPVDFLDDHVSASQLSVPEVEVPLTQRRIPPVEAPSVDDLPVEDSVPSFLLVDHQSGRTYRGTAPHAVIGRERMHCDIVLRDPNISRRHAELTFDEASRSWFVRDLGSTNGTLVNDVDIAQCQLHDGDLITLGLMNLEFREAS